jgi:TolA-binding protein
MYMKKPLVIACSLVFAAANVAHADEASDLKAKLEALQKQMDQLKGQLESVTEQMRNQKQAVTEQKQEQAKSFIQKKPGDDLTFTMGGGEVTLYGYLDVSVDYTTKGIANRFGNGGSTDLPVGNVG